MRIFRYSLIVIALLALPSCGNDSPSNPGNPGGTPLTAAQITATVAFSNATAAAQNINATGPAGNLFEGIVDITFANTAGSATATVNGTATLLFSDNSRGNSQTIDPVSVPGGGSVTVRKTFSPKVPTTNPKTPNGVEVNVTSTDTLNNIATLLQESAASSLGWGQRPVRPCTSGSTVACLENGRFQVEVGWRTNANDSLVPANVDTNFIAGSAVFLFGVPAGQGNDLLVQLLDNCNNNDHFWVFAASQTNVEFELTVTDTQSNVQKTWRNPLGEPADAITDTQAFATCPGPVPVP